MARPTIKTICEMNATNKRQLMSAIGAMDGMYELEIKPRRNTRSLQQLRWYWSCICPALAQYLNDQDYEPITSEGAHELLKAKFLTVSVVHPATGEVVGSRSRSTGELTTLEFADYCERARVWLADFFGIIVPDPEPIPTTTSKEVAAA